MIDFRYHLVSIVAVFLALAIGIVLGSTELQGNTLDVLRSSSDSLKNQLNAVSAQRDSYAQEIGADQQFLQSAEGRLLAGTLDGQRLVIITEPGAPGAVTDGVKQAAELAGATVTGVVSLQPKFNDLSGATQASLAAINGSIAAADGTVLATPADPRTGYQQQAAQLIATAILARSTAAAGLGQPAAQTLMAAYAQDGYLSGVPAGPATLAVIVIPQSAPADGQSDPASQVLLALAQEFAEASAATVVVGSQAGSSPAGSAMSALRSSSVSGQVSSVDNADATLGQISAIWALADQVAGNKPNSYGISGASAISPVPLPVPSVTSAPTAPRSAATGKPTSAVTKKAVTKP